MRYTTLFAALSLLASSPVVTALPHGDHPPAAVSLPAHLNTTASMPKPTGTGSPHPPGCTCSHCMPHKSAPYGNSTSIPVPKHNCTSTMMDRPAHTSFPVSNHIPKTKTIVVTSTMFDEPSYILFSSAPTPAATHKAMAMDSSSPSSPPTIQTASTSSPQNSPPGIQVEDQKLGIGLAVGFLVLAIFCIIFIFWRRSKGEFVYKWGQG